MTIYNRFFLKSQALEICLTNYANNIIGSSMWFPHNSLYFFFVQYVSDFILRIKIMKKMNLKTKIYRIKKWTRFAIPVQIVQIELQQMSFHYSVYSLSLPCTMEFYKNHFDFCSIKRQVKQITFIFWKNRKFWALQTTWPKTTYYKFSLLINLSKNDYFILSIDCWSKYRI